MPNSKIYFGKIKIKNIKFGKEDVELFFGKHKNYPISIPITNAEVTCSNATYNGVNQVASNIVVVFSGITLVEGVDYTVTKNNGGTNVGTYEVEVTGTGDNYEGTASGTFTINKVTPTVTAPTAKVLTYNGSAQELVNAASTNWGTLQYSLDNSSYSTSIPSGTNATSYTVYYKVVGDTNINDVAANSISVSIAKADTSYTAPTAKSLTYNTSAQALLNAGAVTGGTIYYSSDNSTWSTTIPTGTNANTYTSYWKITGDSNHNDKASASISTTISPKAVSSPTITLSQDSYVYSNTACQPTPTVKDGSTTISSSEYTVSYSDNTNVGTATCTITDKTGGNYTVSGSKTFTITKVTPTVTAPTPKTLTFNNANQVLANAGSTNWGTIQYCLNNSGGTYSTTVPSASAANVTYKVWYKVVGNSNINDVAPASIDCMIAEKRVTTPTIVLDPTSYTYNGSAHQPSVTVKDGSVVIPAAEYTTTYSNNTNAGTATVTITDNTAGNYYISGTTTFTINKASGSVTTAPTAKSLTYNTAAQQLVNAGSGTGTMMYKLDSGSWSTSIPTATNATSYTVYYKASASTNYNESASGSVSVTIAKVTPTVTAPTAKSLTYNGSAQQLANAGSTNWGTMQYSTASSGTYSASIPSGTSAGGYEVWYKVVGNSNVNDVAAAKITVNIAKANPSYTAPTAKSLTYNGSAQALLNAGSTSHGTIQYSSDNSSWSTTIPSQTNANTYTSYWRLVGDGNHNDVSSTSISTTIAKANGSVTINGVSLIYNGTARNLATVSNNTGTMHYKLGSGSWSTSIPTAVNADSYTVYWYMDASTNYNGIASASSRYVSSSIGKADQSAPGITGATTTYPTTATATASGGGGVGSLEWESAQSQSSVGSHTTRARWSGNSNYNASPWSSYATVQMNKAAGSVTINGVSLTYNATARNLATVSNNTGTMHYSTNGTSWSTSIPTATNANSYTVYWYMDASTNYNGIASASSRYVSSTIGKADQSAPTATGATTTYNTTATATASGGGGQGSIEWSNGNTQTSVGSKTTKARWSGNSNYNASPYSNEVTVQMNKAAGSVTTAPVNTNYTYNGAARAVASAGSGTGTMYYRLGTSGSFSTTMPTMTNAGSDTLYYYAAESTNYTQSSTGSITVSIQRASRTISFTSAPIGVTVGSTITVAASPSAGSGDGTITFSSSDTSIATVSGSSVTCIAEGTVTITATISQGTNYNSASTNYSLSVLGPYVEIAGIKWARKNVGANSITDYGLYFQWGDTQGYTAAQVGSSSSKKAFNWISYKYGNGTSSPGKAGITKYNSTDGLTTLEASDDAAQAAWGGSWRMPTTEEYVALSNAVNTAWTNDYQGTGVSGLVCTDKTDSSKVLFFPAAGNARNGSVTNVGGVGVYWSSSVYNVLYAYCLRFNSSDVIWQYRNDQRHAGFAVRGVLG